MPAIKPKYFNRSPVSILYAIRHIRHSAHQFAKWSGRGFIIALPGRISTITTCTKC
jgi:hypothetical protein